MKKLFALTMVATLAIPLFATDGAVGFKAKCAGCHGVDGTKAMPSMGVKPLNSADVKGKSDEQLATIISKGQGKMPAYAGKMSDDEIKAAVAYVRSLK